jgi:hypothetical protein
MKFNIAELNKIKQKLLSDEKNKKTKLEEPDQTPTKESLPDALDELFDMYQAAKNAERKR